MTTIRAIALVGFYRGEDLIHPGQTLELPRQEFAELRSFNKVEHAPAEEVGAPSIGGKSAGAVSVSGTRK